jgi:hypothetical protein
MAHVSFAAKRGEEKERKRRGRRRRKKKKGEEKRDGHWKPQVEATKVN